MNQLNVIAVDGLAASGKGTLAKMLAAHYGWPHLDTGLLYRAAAALVLKAGADPTNAPAVLNIITPLAPEVFSNLIATHPDLRSDTMGQMASTISVIPELRQKLFDLHRDFALNSRPGAVLDGRDIGTLICPEAPAKLFITADVGARATRRTKELQARGQSAIEEAIRAELATRDHRDQTRAIAPTKPAADAFVIDNTNLTIAATFEAALAFVKERLAATR